MIDYSYWPFFFLAILGAIVANATGAGGGVVFVPAFTVLEVSGASIIATSFAIQCFGMTAGTLAWRKYASAQLVSTQLSGSQPSDSKSSGSKSSGSQLNGGDGGAPNNELWQQYWPLVAVFTVPAVLGVLLGQYMVVLESAATVKSVFKGFSVLFGVSILLTTVYIVKAKRTNQSVIQFDQALYLVAMVIGLVGGMVTAWLSIGVGELVAVMLILMRFPVRFAIGVAVSVSAICVWVGVQKYLWLTSGIDFNVLFFAAPAAVIGGTVAKRITSLFSPVQLKIFIAAWILISAIAM